MTRNCYNVIRKLASLDKYADHPSKYKSRQDWVSNSQLYKTLPDADRVQALNDDWYDWKHEQQMTNYARQTGQSTDDMTGTFRNNQMIKFNGQPVSTNVNQSNPKNELPRQWFDNAGYTEAEYNKYKSRGYSLHPVTRENMIHTWIARDSKVNKMRQHAESTGQPTDNMTATFSGGRMTQLNGQPVRTDANQNTKPSAGSSTTNAVAANGSSTATTQTLTVAPGYPAVPNPTQKVAQKPAPKSAKSWVDSKVNQEYTDVYTMPVAPMSVDEIYKDPEPVQKPAPVDKGLDMSGFSLAGLGSNSVLDRVPERLRSPGGYRPEPTKLKEVDLNSLF